MRLAALSFALAALSIPSIGASQPASPTPGPVPEVSPTPIVYPPAPTSTASTNYFGTVVRDPYRPLEDIDAPATKAWIASENAITHAYLDAVPARAAIGAAYRKLENVARTSPPFREGKRYIFTHNTGLQTQSVYYIRDSENGPARVFFDPNLLSKDGSIQVSSTNFSRDGSLMAYSTSTGGEDWQTWHVKVVATGRDTTDLVRWSKFSGAAWQGNLGFYYSGYDEPKAENKTLAAVGVEKVWFHRLGTPQSADRLVFASTAHPDRFVGIETTEDERYTLLDVSTEDTDDLRWKTRDAPDTAFRPLTGFKTNVSYNLIGNDGSRLYFTTNLDAPRFRLVAIDVNDPKHVVHDVVPQAADKLDSVSLIGNRFYLGYLHDSYSRTVVATTTGRRIATLALPGLGSGGIPFAKREDRIAYYGFTSYAIPYRVYRFDTKTMATTIYSRPHVDFDSDDYVTDQVFATSKDGTKVPVFVTHRKGLVLDGTAPTLMYGYGGFDVSETPYYSTDRALWLKMGGVYADVVLRGGGDFGEAWHDAGRLEKKQNVFDDFTAAGEMLIARKFTSTPRLAIDGGSNGGLLVGAVLTQHPNLFGAAIAEQGVLDMLRYHLYTVGKAWIPEYGDADANAEQFNFLYAYSPLHNVRPGTAYPPTLITTADHDDRVLPAHSFKFAAALQAAQAGSAPILLRVQTNEGHFSGLTTDESIALYSDFYAFLVKSLQFTPDLK